MDSKNFLKHFFTIGFGTFLNLLIGLFTTPIITRMVDPTEYGQLSIFTIYSNVAVMVLGLGLDQALVRYYHQSNDIRYKKKLLYICVLLPTITGIIGSALLIFNSIYQIVPFEFNTTITVLLCVYTMIQILYRFSMAIIRLNYNSKLYSKLQVLLKIIYISLAISLIFIIQKNSLLLLCIATVVSSFVCLIVSIVSQKTIWNFFDKEYQKIKIDYKELLKYSYPFIFSMGIAVMFQAVDKLSLNYFCDYSTVGVYSSAMSLVHIFSILQTTFNTLWSPMAIEHYTKDPDDKNFYQKGNTLITIVMFFLGINLILFKDLFALFLGTKYREAAYVFPFLIFNPIMYTISETTVNGLVFKKKSNCQVIVALGACISNIIGNFILIPIIGSKGAAISTGISYIIFFTLRTILSNRYFYVDFKLKKFYFITFVVILYALYSTFIPMNIIGIVGYVVCISILIILYKQEIKEYYFKFFKK